MPAEAIKINIPATTDTEYDLLCGALRQIRVKSLRSWAMKHGFALTTTYSAARGRRGGSESRKIQKKLRDTLYAKAE